VAEEGVGFRENNRLRGVEDKKIEEEFDRKIVGRIGSEIFFLGGLEALFLDLGHSNFFVISDVSRFHGDGYSIESILKIPYEWNHGFVIEIETDFGKGKFLLDTGLTFSLLRESFVKGKDSVEAQGDLKRVISSKFQIGGEDFGREAFYSYPLGSSVGAVDGILGMNFFKRYALLLDFKNNVVYIGRSQNRGAKK
jgi:hypothetical protein